MTEDAISGATTLAAAWELPLSYESSARLGLYASKLLEWNRRVNLTGARDLHELLDAHLPDSFALAKLCPARATVVDVGSGGGLPAIPFAILRPDCHVTLVEPRAKRVAFLNMALRTCDCRLARVVRARAENMPSSGFSVATSRATFGTESWLRIASRLLSTGGMAVVFAARPTVTASAAAVLRRSVDYHTSSGVPRWAGLFVFM
ncbi:MAG: 16S rRNA (guanine(527)-N(7))-methyltransferase RsmG [Deltaproteobacteria bacterium]|jgi:16S rRNA (guanine527-N7)-methyltransferase|nr:16S rRNA (guanine(527)-N(7))-methyltransferase RsmG [Deltaproteobacteria bacterium]